MEKTDLNLLLEKSSGTDIPLLLSVKEKAKKQASEEPSPANIAALEKVTKMLESAMNTKENKENLEVFPKIKTVANVVDYLHSVNRKVQKSKVAADIKKGRGGLRRNSDLFFTKKVLDDYASTLPLVAFEERASDEINDLGKKKLEAEIARIQENTKAITFDRKVKEGKYIARSEVELELASRAVTLGVNLKSVFEIKTNELINTVNGDNNKSLEFIRFFETMLDETLNEFSKPMSFELDYEIVQESDEIDPEDNSNSWKA